MHFPSPDFSLTSQRALGETGEAGKKCPSLDSKLHTGRRNTQTHQMETQSPSETHCHQRRGRAGSGFKSHSLCKGQKRKEPIWLKPEPARAQFVHFPFMPQHAILSSILGYPRKCEECLDIDQISVGNNHGEGREGTQNLTWMALA